MQHEVQAAVAPVSAQVLSARNHARVEKQRVQHPERPEPAQVPVQQAGQGPELQAAGRFAAATYRQPELRIQQFPPEE